MPNALAKMLEHCGDYDGDLVRELAGLRSEIAALRAELRPVSSLIIVGQQALEEFRRLAKHDQ